MNNSREGVPKVNNSREGVKLNNSKEGTDKQRTEDNVEPAQPVDVVMELAAGENCGLKVDKNMQIMQMVKGTKAEGKFAVGNQITHVNGVPITSLAQWEGLVAKGGKLTVKSARGLLSQAQEPPADRMKNVQKRDGFLYQLVTIEHQRGCKFGLGIKHYQNKVLVSRVDDGSLSAKCLIATDRIVDINGQPVSDKDVARDLLLKSLQKSRKVSLLVERASTDDAIALANQALIASEQQPPSVAMASDIAGIVARQKDRMAKGQTSQKKGIMRKHSGQKKSVTVTEEKKEFMIAADTEGKELKKVKPGS